MAKTTALKVQVAPDPIEFPVAFPLTPQERIHLKELLDDPVMRKAWANTKAGAPSLYPGELNSPLGNQIATNRFHEMRGWDLFKAAILTQVAEPVQKRVQLVDNYPDAGLIRE